MTLEEYKTKMTEDEEWAPGWQAIDSVFEKLYPNQDPAHFGTLITSRAILGGDEYLDGFSIYQSPNGYMHLLTYGMTNLYVDEKFFGQEWSGWGYEMTMKLLAQDFDDCKWVISMMSNLARYTYTSKRFFEPFQYVGGNGSSLHIGAESNITGLLLIEDTEVNGIETVHGHVDFIQLVGITTDEVEAIKECKITVPQLVELIKTDNPFMVTNMKRTKSYI